MENKNYIRIHKPDSSRSYEAFVDLMSSAERILNGQDLSDSSSLTPSRIEEVSVDAIKEASRQFECFKADEIILVSGSRFPDIEIKPSFGVEVKSSKSGWSSIGSSIIESTRIEGIEHIYMVFGNLSGEWPEFRCRPYGDVLTDIKVTHSPRYLIDMETSESVFDQMDVSYDIFRKLSDSSKIETAQRYAREKLRSRGSVEMPWWIKNLKDNGGQGTIRIWNSLDIETKRSLTAQCMILFPNILNPAGSPTKYNEATLWLCSYHQIVSPNIRDLFSAGGKIDFNFNGENLKIPAVYGKIRNHLGLIRDYLDKPDSDFFNQILIYNKDLCSASGKTRFSCWIEQLISMSSGMPVGEFLL